MQQHQQKISIHHQDERTLNHTPLTNLQLELLKLYGLKLAEEELLDIKALLARYFADRLTRRVDQIWQDKGLTEADMEQWLNDEQQ
jgi:hypothetical protein